MSNNLFLACLKAEYLKARRSSLLWATVVFFAIIFLLVFFRFPVGPDRGAESLAKVGGLWRLYWGMSWALLTMFLPVYLILIPSLGLRIENRDQSWKKIFTLPVSKAHIYFAKLLFFVLLLITEILALLVMLTIGGYLLQLLHADLNFSSYALPWRYMLWMSGIYAVSFLGILALHYVCSLFMRNHTLLVILGMVLLFISLSPATNTLAAIKFFPYSFPSLALYQETKVDKEYLAFIDSALTLSTIYFIVIIGIGFLLFIKSRKRHL